MVQWLLVVCKPKMKETNYRVMIRDLMLKGFTPVEITKMVGCDEAHVYRTIDQEKLRLGVKPTSVDRLAKLEERIRQLEKVVAALASMKRMGGPGVTASPESQESRLQRLISGSEHP